MRFGSHVNFWGTIGTAGVLLWGLSQGKAKPEYSPTYTQIQTLPQPHRRTAANRLPRVEGARFGALHRLTTSATAKRLRPLRRFAVANSKESDYPSAAAAENEIRPDRAAEIKLAPRHLAEDVTVKNLCKLRAYAETESKEPVHQAASEMPRNAVSAQEKLHARQLTKNVTIKNLCKLRDYAAAEPKEPAYRLASKEEGDESESPTEIKVTPVIRDAMNKVRPKQLTGTLTVEGKEYAFGSGGHGQSIPYGDYLITPGAIGSWGSRHGAIGVADGTIPDPKLHRDRDGIELHAATNDKLQTNGCVSIRKDQWPQFRKQVFALIKENKKVYLHVSDQGATVSTKPLEFIGETISEPTFLEAMSAISEPTRKASE